MKIARISVWQLTMPLSEPYWLSGGRLKFEQLDSTFVRIDTDGRATVVADVGTTYAVRTERPLRGADPPGRNGKGMIQLRRVPEPFDLGTDLVVEMEDPEGGTFPVEGRVARVSRDPEHPNHYAVTLRIHALDAAARERLLNTLLCAPDEAVPPPDVRNP